LREAVLGPAAVGARSIRDVSSDSLVVEAKAEVVSYDDEVVKRRKLCSVDGGKDVVEKETDDV
jgi:hypothetical protein